MGTWSMQETASPTMERKPPHTHPLRTAHRTPHAAHRHRHTSATAPLERSSPRQFLRSQSFWPPRPPRWRWLLRAPAWEGAAAAGAAAGAGAGAAVERLAPRDTIAGSWKVGAVVSDTNRFLMSVPRNVM